MTCGFYAINGKHCMLNGHCCVCKQLQPNTREDTEGYEKY